MSADLPADAARTENRYVLFTLLAGLLPCEILFISLAYDAYRPALLNSDQWFGYLSDAGQLSKVLMAALMFTVLGLWPRIPKHLDSLRRATESYPYYYFVAANLASFAIFFWYTSAIFGDAVDVHSITPGKVAAWAIAMAATGVFWLLAMAPPRFWRQLFTAEKLVFLASLAVGVIAWLLASHAQTLWGPLSELTLRLSLAILDLFYSDIAIEPASKTLRVEQFVVTIAPDCSGYEGMALMAVFTGFYLSVFRQDFRFPQALWLFPIGIVIIWIFNNLRIAALIAIGASISPAVAINGFHSHAGWISFITVIVVTLTIAYRLPYFSTVPRDTTAVRWQVNLPMALLIPFIVLMSATILTLAMSSDFDWFYPLRVVAVGFVLGWCWKHYGLHRLSFNYLPWIAGAGVFLLWIVLVPRDAGAETAFRDQLADASWVTAAAWLAFRFVGSVITVPIAEELLFRGYLLARLARQEIRLQGQLPFSWVALAGSAILFGLLHGNWIAGIAAGLVYGWVRYRGQGIQDAIIAHAFTNLLLSLYVVYSGAWSLW